MADHGGSDSETETSSPVLIPSLSTFSATNLSFLDLDGFFERSMRMEAAKVSDTRTLSVPRTLRREMSESVASEFLSRTSLLERTSPREENSTAGPTWWRESELPVARKLRHRSRRETLSRQQSAPAREFWPAVDDDVLACCKKRLLSFDLDPTTLSTNVLCHLALEMFVSAELPAGLDEERVRRFILAVRASMLDNPYHNFYHVFDVMQTTLALATVTGAMARLDAWERFGLLSAALCHDLVNPQPSTLNP